jgi:hypothetical protein
MVENQVFSPPTAEIHELGLAYIVGRCIGPCLEILE